jgi:hypothetical protein
LPPELRLSPFMLAVAAPEKNIAIVAVLNGGWQVAGYTSTLDGRSAFILLRHPDETSCNAARPMT